MATSDQASRDRPGDPEQQQSDEKQDPPQAPPGVHLVEGDVRRLAAPGGGTLLLDAFHRRFPLGLAPMMMFGEFDPRDF
ncbi:MAG: hypothetical protein R2749_24875 [Acidimicrobiales bacterium]